MSRDSRVAVTLLAVAVLLGVGGDVLFEGRPLGLNVLLFALSFVAALAVLLRVARAPLHQGRRWMAAPLLLFSAAFLWHDSPLLTAANALALAGAVAVGALRRPAPVDAGVADYAEALAAAGAGAVAGSIHLLQYEVPWEDTGARLKGPMTRGLALGLPLLLLFGGLFAAADTVFRHLLTSAVPSLDRVWVHVLLAAALAWLSAGLLRDLVARKATVRLAAPSLGRTEVAVALGALNVLFAAFVAVQARVLFAHDVPAGVSYAQYARHGFFELVAVSVLVLPVVLAANTVARARLVRGLSFLLVALELAVAASALERLWLYQQQFGLTELRIWTTGVVLWLAAVFVWLCLTTLRERGRFAVGALVLGFAATAALNVLNPDALIARVDVSRPHVDTAYLAGLSDDAVPTLLARRPELLAGRRPPHVGLLGWNLSRSDAARLLRSSP